jgi:uncharacterized protein YraI
MVASLFVSAALDYCQFHHDTVILKKTKSFMRSIMKRLALRITALIITALYLTPVSAQAANLLIDPGFEGEQYVLVSIDLVDSTTFSVPQGWWGGVAREPHTESWMNVQPTGFPHTGPYKLSGGRSLHVARGFASFTAWVYQQVSVQPNTDVQGGASAFIESGATAVIRVGIDPNGGTNPFEPSVIWSDWQGGLYQWNAATVNARAGSSGVVTLFLYASQGAPNNPNGVYWDNAFLNGIAGTGLNSGGATQQTSAQFVIPTVNVNVRAGAGTSFRRIGAASPADSFALRGEIGDWYEIDFNGQTGYISKQFSTLSNTPAEAAPPVESLEFTANYALRLRAAPTSESAELARIPYTTLLKAVGRSADNVWVQVVYEGQTGWVAARYGRLSGNINSLPLR